MMKQNTSLSFIFFAALALVHLPVQAAAPVGVRPCCAFGKDLKAEVAGVPVPFFSVANVQEISSIGQHQYNDGSASVSGSLLGVSREHNGLIYTQKGGFIDTAHVRDTADFTYFLFQQIRTSLGKEKAIALPAELRKRVVVLKTNARQLSEAERDQAAADIAGVMAFRLAQWHEIAQWFGMISVSGFQEYASAFSPEDLYSNMLGANLAMAILKADPHLTVQGFEQAMDAAFAKKLRQYRAAPIAETERQIEALDGTWWDSDKRLPNKWVVIHRDYHLALKLSPNGVSDGLIESLPTALRSGDPISDWAELALHAEDNEAHFSALPSALRQRAVWHASDFQTLADFAKAQDQKEHQSEH
ncbi:hypothetical protein VST7929_01529 [Vibrio stylophorae]|uniref:DUF4056 domain-containing protein n=1 Tax=Vibrio stylophorae TaxID=659351 RepID=A0ABM8ZTL4_9VIBR|nr:DUF4056 domain-containing protein [Vibrio stylophorae]CAH0533658.1 hypothetical protein VST7929_01529 [Vibrio stylophorae]